MTNIELKEFVKLRFNLTETSKQVFATATLEDGTKISNDKSSEFAEGDKVFVEIDGELKPAPEGDHITESGITITLDSESIITGMKRPDEAGEGSEDLAKDIPVEELMSADKLEEVIIDEEIKMVDMPSLEEIIGVIADVVDEKMMDIREKMSLMEDEIVIIRDKMSAFSAESASEVTIPTKKFAKAINAPTHNTKRYEQMLKKVTSLKK